MPDLVTADPGPPGSGRLSIVRDRHGRSVVTRAFATSPLRLLTPRNLGSAAWIYTSSYGGGLVDGDCIRLEAEVGPDAAAFLSTQASTKVYRSDVGASAEVHGRVAPGGLLAVVPDPVVCFAAARYRQVQSFDVDAGGALVLVDWISSGRHGSGERWAFDKYSSRLRVRSGGRLVLHDAVSLRSAEADVRERIGRFDVLATVLVFGAPVLEHASRMAERAAGIPLGRRPEQLISAAAIGSEGWLLRVAGTSFERTAAMVRAELAFLPCLLGDDPWARKW